MASGPFLAVDWGGTNVRAWRLDETGAVAAGAAFPLGVSRLAPGEAAARFQDEIRPALGAEALPALLCGMIGSNLGWVLAPYLDCPASPVALAGALIEAAPGVRIVPGLVCAGLVGPDVMRGEETQILGWLAGDPARGRGRRLLCLPGTHSKWARVADGAVERFVTAMTGELHAVLGAHSLLRFAEVADDPAAFDDGVAAAGDGGALSARLFGLRGLTLRGGLAAASASAWLSGLLIGAEIAALRPFLAEPDDGPVVLIGEGALVGLYARALAACGAACEIAVGETPALAGLEAIWSAL